jgi:hypothetical protein
MSKLLKCQSIFEYAMRLFSTTAQADENTQKEWWIFFSPGWSMMFFVINF